MTNLSTQYTHQVICSVCFATHYLNPAHSGLNPVRHGFQVIGGSGQGHSGGWHTGPCGGTGFPHFGHSTEGTVWALGQVKSSLEYAQKHLDGLLARPDLNWHFQPKKYQAATWQNRKSSYIPDGPAIERVLKPGTEMEVIKYRQEGMTYDQEVRAPSYEGELANRVGEAKRNVDSLTAQRDAYEKAIREWKPQAPTKAPGKVEMVHLAKTVNLPKEYNMQSYDRPNCKRVSQRDAKRYATTHDKSKVTCLRCKKST